MNRAARISILTALLLLGLGGCARREMVVELYGTILYEKPEIRSITHNMNDLRESGGEVVVQILVEGDPGLHASFDIYPDITEGHGMTETDQDGLYRGEFRFPADTIGGSYTVIGRLAHDEAGEVQLHDPEPLTIPLLTPSR